MEISVHPAKPDPTRAHTYGYGFQPLKVDKLSGLENALTHQIWSPILYKDGKRCEANFIKSDIASLDFDSGAMSIKHALEFFKKKNLSFILGTTKSHQIEKVSSSGEISPACDRFRILLPFDRPITTLDEYKFNLKTLSKTLPVDGSCTDGARFFFPCTEIIAINEGNPLKWAPLPSSMQQNRGYRPNHLRCFKSFSMIPSSIKKFLRDGVPQGGRHKKVYHIGAALTEAGYSPHEIIELVMASPLSAIGYRDIYRGVMNAFRKVAGE